MLTVRTLVADWRTAGAHPSKWLGHAALASAASDEDSWRFNVSVLPARLGVVATRFARGISRARVWARRRDGRP